ncbi:keratin-associated protein 21-1-like [Rhipicephalus sanguineus]|uniref:keratin-associated protein 21-1-like n=1 Tax=Rhipicephalus sanguineus TaxID=34632 RepID=UPI0018954BD4|nr:keratin-associated protein 21-1-like [Rhipicephalus sanguineus]
MASEDLVSNLVLAMDPLLVSEELALQDTGLVFGYGAAAFKSGAGYGPIAGFGGSGFKSGASLGSGYGQGYGAGSFGYGGAGFKSNAGYGTGYGQGYGAGFGNLGVSYGLGAK